MDSDTNNYLIEEQSDHTIKDILIKYLYNWKWFVLSVVVSMISGFVYLRYQAPMYEVNASILIKDDKKGGNISDELSAFEDLGIFKNGKNIDNEIEILKSRALMTRVVNELHLNISYYSFGRPIEHERFFDTPISYHYLPADSAVKEITGNWVLTPLSSITFKLKNGANDEEMGEFSFGDTVVHNATKFIFSTTDFFSDSYLNNDFRIVLSPIEAVVNRYLGAIKIEPVNKTSNVIIIRLRDPLKEKAIAIVDNLIKQHNLDAIADKNQVSKNTADFINERIQYISSELSGVESEAENFKVKNKLTDVDSEAKIFLQSGSESEKSQLEVTTQIRIAEFMSDYIQKNANPADLIPANIGLENKSLGEEINNYNKMVLERSRLLKNAGEKNPAIANLNDQIAGIRLSIKESLRNLQKTLKIEADEIAKKESEINSKISTVPKYEREYRNIQRQQQIKEALYLYLLQKREETNIALAVTVANAKIIDKAYGNGEIIAPKKQIIFMISLILGFVFPVVVFYALTLFDSKVHGKKDIDKTGIPFLGDIPSSITKEHLVVSIDGRSNVAEAFRLLRTNMEFVTANHKGANKTIFVTSTIGKEGKSFVALNLAVSLAISGKKTLLLGTDLRAPKILQYLELTERKGLTNYITDQSLALNDVIYQLPEFGDIFILPSGPVPPNPTELLMHTRVKDLFEQVKHLYDYIIVDTAPAGLVADTLLLSNFGDYTLFVVRANYLDKRLLRIAETFFKEKRLPNISILLNGSDHTKGYGYGYGYGYAYGGYDYGNDEIKPLWRKIFGFWKKKHRKFDLKGQE